MLKQALAGVLTAVVMTVGIGGVTMFAASPSQRDCEASGGTFAKVNGQDQCIVTTTTNVGNSSNSQTTTTTTDTTGQGNLGNKTESTSDCSGPGGSSSSGHCK